MKKFLTTIVISLFMTCSLSAAPLPKTWGISEYTCSEALRSRDDLGKVWDEWVFINAQGWLSGLNFWHYEKYGYAKKIGYNGEEYVRAHIFNECKKDKNTTVGIILLNYLLSLPDDK